MKAISNGNIREKVYNLVRDYVVSTELHPGVKIDEGVLAKVLGVSKTPIREALSKLALEGIVVIKQNRGSFKVKLSDEDIKEIHLLKETLEGLCVRIVGNNADDKLIRKLKVLLDEFEKTDLQDNYLSYAVVSLKFYTLIYKASGHPWLIRSIQNMNAAYHMLRLQYFSSLSTVKYSLEAHRELIQAFEKKNGKLAEAIRKKMIRSALKDHLIWRNPKRSDLISKEG